MEQNTEKEESIRSILLENQQLINENHELLEKINRRAVLSFWIRIAWTLLLMGAPFVVYYYLVQPYFEALGSSFQTFQTGLQEVPGWKQFYHTMSGDSGTPQ